MPASRSRRVGRSKKPVPDASKAASLLQQSAGAAIFSEEAWVEIGRSLGLTRRELQVVRGVFDDCTEYAIALNLGISPHTVHTYLERLRHKLTVMDRGALVLQVVQEFLRLTARPDSTLPPVCGIRSAGRCNRCD